MFQVFGISIEVYIIVLIIAVPLFFFWRWLFRRFKVTRNSLYSVIASIAMASFVYIAAISCFLFIITYYPNRSFDRDAWLDNKALRYEYTRSLVHDKLLDGKTKEQVKDYLGNPDSETANSIIYDIGFKPAIINIDIDYLEIIFENDTVSEIIEGKS